MQQAASEALEEGEVKVKKEEGDEAEEGGTAAMVVATVKTEAAEKIE